MGGGTVPALIGRSEEQGRLDALLDAARTGRSGGLVIRGEPGVGKTSLLDDAVAKAGDFRVLRTLGMETESDLAFSGLLELLRPVLDRSAQLPGVQAAALEAALGGGGEVDRFAVYAATLGILAAVAEERPLLCVMDDAQWVDPPRAAHCCSARAGSPTKASSCSSQRGPVRRCISRRAASRRFTWRDSEPRTRGGSSRRHRRGRSRPPS